MVGMKKKDASAHEAILPVTRAQTPASLGRTLGGERGNGILLDDPRGLNSGTPRTVLVCAGGYFRRRRGCENEPLVVLACTGNEANWSRLS